MDRVLLGVDIGTTATKTILADVEGNVRAEASAPTRGRSTEANWALESGLYDLRTEGWARDICAAKEAL